jgi:nucleoid DNA-binding protein
MATTMMKAPTTNTSKPRTKSELFGDIATKTELSRKQVAAVFEQMGELIKKDLKARGIFTVPGLMKIKRITKPARPARKGVPNPFKPGELMDVAAKPARKVVKVQPLKALKSMV